MVDVGKRYLLEEKVNVEEEKVNLEEEKIFSILGHFNAYMYDNKANMNSSV